MRAGEQAADASGAFERAAQVIAAGVADGGRVVAIALLDDPHPVIDILGRGRERPASWPSVLEPLAQTAKTVVNEIRPPSRVELDINEPVLIVVGIALHSILARGQVAIVVINERGARTARQLILRVHGESGHTVVSSAIEIPGRIVKVTAIVTVDR